MTNIDQADGIERAIRKITKPLTTINVKTWYAKILKDELEAQSRWNR